ncbi:hypothetical protein [Ferrovibrio sp.]|uniref:hypothetical protein n=1 Tax=Ferrovibrio sp. TaxID=1917215 RepID=UPI003D12BF43
MIEQTPNMVSLDAEQQRQLKRLVLEDRPYIDRVSLSFCLLLLEIRRSRNEDDIIIMEMDALEGLAPSSTRRPADMFLHPPLTPLWHKHVFMPRHVVGNLGAHWGLLNKQHLPIEEQGNSRLDRMIADVFSKHDEVSDDFIRDLTTGFIDKPFWYRFDKGVTGDWLIFAKHKGENYYLHYTEHSKSSEDDARIVDYLRRTAAAEFSFLFE